MIKIDGKTKHITGVGLRLVYDNIKVIALIEGTEQTVTSTNYKSEEFDIERKVLNRIGVLGLKYIPENQDVDLRAG